LLSFRSAAEESASAVALLSVIPKLNELKWGDLLLLLPVLIRPIGANPG
jgi:hypothetical protein